MSIAKTKQKVSELAPPEIIDLTVAFVAEDRPQAVVDALPFAVWRLDREGRITFCNKAYVRFNGFEGKHLLGKTVDELFDQRRASLYGASDELVMSTKATYVSIEEKVSAAPGHRLFVEVTKTPITDAAGNVVGMQGMFVDITERKLLDDTARFLAQRSGRSGDISFFHSLAAYLAEVLEADYVSIARSVDHPPSVETLSLVIDGQLQENIAYDLKDTPCGAALGQEFCVFESNLEGRFPDHEGIRELGMQSYIGVTLWGADAQPIGLIAVLSRRPVGNFRLAESVLNMVAVRAAGELERRQAEAALEQSDARWQFALEGVGDGVWDWDLQEHTIFRSRRFHQMLGYEDGELGEGDDAVLNLVHPDDRPHVLLGRSRCIDGVSTTYAVEARLRCKDGSWRWFLQRGLAVSTDAEGRALRLVGSQVDITERKLAEERRILELNLQRSINAASPLAFFVVDDRTDEIRHFDRQFFSIWGFDHLYDDAVAGKFRGIDLYEACGERVVDPDWIHDQLVPLHNTTNRDIVDIEVLLVDGRTLRIHTAQVRGEDDQYFGRMYMHEDITDRKHAEELRREADRWFASIVESAMDAIITIDQDQRIITFNTAASKIFGVEPTDRTERFISDFTTDELAGPVASYVSNFIDGDAQVAAISERSKLFACRTDGTEFPVEASLAKMEIDGRKLVSIMVRDLSERFANEAARQSLEARIRLSQRMEAIGSLASGIAHDFNNILGAIYGYTDLARADAEGNEAVLESLDELAKAGRRAAALVRQILAFSRPEEISRASLHAGPLVREAVQFLRAASPSTVEIELSIADNVRMITANPTQIHQVVMNLGTNGVHAMSARPGRLSISLANYDRQTVVGSSSEFGPALPPPEVSEGEWVRLSVTDTGHGMDRSELERIFDPFYTTKGHGQGAGLGLAVVHRIVRDSDGLIEVSSEPRVGTRFDVYFPAAAALVPVGPESQTEPPMGRGERVLFVDDEAALGAFGKRSLEALNFNVVAESRALAALETFRADPTAFDLVITDLTMPDLTGADLAIAIHAIRPELPVLLMSGFSAAMSDESLREARAVELLSKPFTGADLGRAVARALATRV